MFIILLRVLADIMHYRMQNDKCKAVVGNHEANVVLKDNDLRTKISLHSQDTSQVMETLRKDSDLLGKLGVMDYRYVFIIVLIIIVTATDYCYYNFLILHSICRCFQKKAYLWV